MTRLLIVAAVVCAGAALWGAAQVWLGLRDLTSGDWLS